MINLNQLRAFYQAAKYLNFSTAAKKLFITQPAVTAQIKAFEDYLDLKLFKKRGGKLYLTDEAKIIYRHSQKLFEYEEKIENSIDEIKKLKQGTLRIGTARTYARYFMPFLISHFREVYPHIRIKLDEGNSNEMVQSIFDMKNELAVVAQVNKYPEISFISFSQEELILVLSPDHALAERNHVSINEIASEQIIMKETGSGTRWIVDDLFHRNGYSPKVLMETSDAEMIKLLVQHGEGISFLVKETITRELEENRLVAVPIKDQKMFLDVSIGYLKSQPLSIPAQAFLESLEKIKTNEKRFKEMRELKQKKNVEH